ncbi:MAG: transposase [Pirellulaceae bacterium]|nr:transposase [Pirellulaceae bacterium]
MYDYRKWTTGQRASAVAERIEHGYPWHGPPHLNTPGEYRIVTGSCFEHRPILSTLERLQWFEGELLSAMKSLNTPCAAWVVLPNHYHVLVSIADMKTFSRGMGMLHGKTSFEMNGNDGTRGRRVWYRCMDRCMRSEAHYYTTLNYIHNNPIKHGYARKWTDWPYSSIHWYLSTKGREWLLDAWRSYPVLNYGDKWDV